MSGEWESTLLLRISDQAYVQAELLEDGCETRELVACPRCHRTSDWLIAVTDDQVRFACRCGHGWRVPKTLSQVAALAQCPSIDPEWTCLGDARRALGFGHHAPL